MLHNIQIRPLDENSNLLSRGKTVLKTGESLDDKIAYASTRAGKRTNVIEVHDVKNNITTLYRPDGTPVKDPTPKRMTKGVTYANINGLPTNIGLIDMIGRMIDEAPTDSGWSGREIATKVLEHFPDRRLEGILTTLRCQVSRGNLGIVKKFQDGREIRYARHA